jgi:hypothetical protein
VCGGGLLPGGTTASSIAKTPRSVLLCMRLSLAQGGAGLGTMGLPERLRALAEEAGFTGVRRLPLENPFNTLFALKP